MNITLSFGNNLLIPILLTLFMATACEEKETLSIEMDEPSQTSPLDNKGIGPITELKLDAGLDAGLANKGKKVFSSKCMACHKFDQKVVGPALQGVTTRRSPEWIMNMMLNTNEMVEKDPIVKSMIAEYMTKMTFQDINEAEARSILEYFRLKDSKQ